MDLYAAGLFTASGAASVWCDEVQQLSADCLLYLRRAVGSLLLGFPGESFLLLVERLGLQDHLLQLKRRVAVQSPLLRGTQTLRHRLFADISIGISIFGSAATKTKPYCSTFYLLWQPPTAED